MLIVLQSIIAPSLTTPPPNPTHKYTQVANWTFKFADTPDEDSPLRRGFFSVFPSLEAYSQQSEGMSKVRPIPPNNKHHMTAVGTPTPTITITIHINPIIPLPTITIHLHIHICKPPTTHHQYPPPPTQQVLRAALGGKEVYSEPTNVFHVAVAQASACLPG